MPKLAVSLPNCRGSKKNLASRSREERIALLDWENPELPIKTQAELLHLNRSSLYYKPKGPSPAEIALKHRIDQIYTQCPFYGSRRITAVLNQEGIVVNRKAVQRHMREMGISGVCPGPNLSKRDQGSYFTSPQYINLLKDAEVRISMDGKGRALDNIFTERLWRSLKYEEVYIKDYSSPREARKGINEYLNFYNYKRVHQSLDYQTPATVFFGET